jgi:transposase-like protein
MVANAKIRRYTADEKNKATARAIEVGYRAAGDELGIPCGTLSCWVFKARQAGTGPAPAAAAMPSGPVPGVAEPAVSPAAAPSQAPPGTPAATAGAPVLTAASSAPPPPTPKTARPRVAKVYTPSQIAQALERVAAIGVRPAAAELGISRNALRDWERKVAKAAKGEGPAPTSGPDPKTVEERRDAAILAEWRKQQGLGPSQIRNQLRRAGTKVSVHTVRRVMEEAGYRPPKVERREHQGSYEALRPNQLWHMDFVHQLLTPTLPRPHLPTLARDARTRNAADGHIGPPTA